MIITVDWVMTTLGTVFTHVWSWCDAVLVATGLHDYFFFVLGTGLVLVLAFKINLPSIGDVSQQRFDNNHPWETTTRTSSEVTTTSTFGNRSRSSTRQSAGTTSTTSSRRRTNSPRRRK